MTTCLTITLDAHRSRLVRETADAQGVTYVSLVHAILDTGLCAGRRPVILTPFGEDNTKKVIDCPGVNG